MSGTQLARIFRVIVKILLVQQAALITDQPVSLYEGGIKLHLQLHILCHRIHRASELVDQCFVRLLKIIDISVIAVSFLGQGLQFIILVVPHSVTENRQEHPRFALRLDQRLEFRSTRHPNVKVTVGTQDHAVVSPLYEILSGNLISQLNACTSGCGTPCLKIFQSIENLLLVGAARSGQNLTRSARIRHDRHAVFRAQVVYQQFHRRFHQRQLILAVHRARYIDEKHQITWR